MRRVQRPFKQNLFGRLLTIRLMVMLSGGATKGIEMVEHVQLAGEDECRAQQKSRSQQADKQGWVASRDGTESSQHAQRLADFWRVILLLSKQGRLSISFSIQQLN